ncbi:permease [Actinoallomurus sp. NPDC052308]|uniref:permease n=1 Tax=Actinoallomurus sp. NPDC052308 TaxID=3155530 RepID=UPI0034329189
MPSAPRWRAVEAAWEEDAELPPAEWGRRPPMAAGPRALLGVVAVAGVLAAGRVLAAPHLREARVQGWATVFVAICVQALPFLAFGATVSAAISTLVPEAFWRRALPRRALLAVPVAGAAGAVLPGCECASVPVAGGLMARGITPAAALAFLLSSPAINPVVLVATAVAFRGHPEMVAARFAASLLVSVAAGWLWLRFGRIEWLRIPSRPRAAHGARWPGFAAALRHDLLHTGGLLVAGAAIAATLNVTVPPAWTAAVAGVPWLSVAVLAALAVVMSICSEADAFVATSLTQFSATAKLAFLVVGPMVDLKLIALQAGTFGPRFAARFVPMTFALAIVASALIGRVLL